MTTPVPILILADNISGTSGIARIARHLALQIHHYLPRRFRVGTLGVGGAISTSARFPFPNYAVRQLDQMIPRDLPEVWLDFAGAVGDGRQEDSAAELATRSGLPRRGIMLTIWNCSWLAWLARPDLYLPADDPLRQFLLSQPFQRWAYVPVDGHCTDGTLSWQMSPILAGMDRLLAYTSYGADVMARTLQLWGRDGRDVDRQQFSDLTVPHLPHGLGAADNPIPQNFLPHDRHVARQTFLSRVTNGRHARPLAPDQLLLAICNTNSQRKDWGLAFQTAAELLRRGHNVHLWGHTDRLGSPAGGYWNLPALARQYGMEQRVLLTTDRLSDDDLAWGYSAADVGLHIGAGEGFGYFGPQAIACGLPVVHGRYAGGVEFVPECVLVEPIAYTLEPQFLLQRPIFDVKDWANKVEWLTKPENRLEATAAPQTLGWDALWPRWSKWLLEGIVTTKESISQ